MSDAEEQARAVLEELDVQLRAHLSPSQYTTAHFDFGHAIITAALQARERAGKQEGVRETWEAAAKKANDIALGADWAVEGCDGEEWVQFNTISREFTVFRNYCRQEAQEVGP